MSPLTRTLLAAALTLPLVALVAGVLAAPDRAEQDRTRPVIIGRVSEDDATAPPERRRPDRDRAPDRQRDDDVPERPPEDPPFTMVTPAPRDLDDEDDGGDDDDDGGDDSEDDRSSGGDD